METLDHRSHMILWFEWALNNKLTNVDHVDMNLWEARYFVLHTGYVRVLSYYIMRGSY